MTALNPSLEAASALLLRLRECLLELPAGPVRNDVLLYAVQTERMVTELKALQGRQEPTPLSPEGVLATLDQANRDYLRNHP